MTKFNAEYNSKKQTLTVEQSGLYLHQINLKADGETSDGYHTFDELYYHRMLLFSVICNTYKSRAWKSKLHHDGTMYDDYFIVGIHTPEGQFTYHYHIDNWDDFTITELPNAPEWDGHTSDDVVRLTSLVKLVGGAQYE